MYTRTIQQQITMLSLGLENIHCSLVIQKKRPIGSSGTTDHQQQTPIDNGFKKMFVENLPSFFDKPKPSDYAITNIAGYIPSLPVNSIFANISFYPSNWPDLNTLPIMGPVTTTNSTDISQNPKTLHRDVRAYDDNDDGNDDNPTGRLGTESIIAQTQNRQTLTERLTNLRTMPPLNGSAETNGRSNATDSREKKLKDTGLLVNNQISYKNLSKLVQLPWKTIGNGVEHGESMHETEIRALMNRLFGNLNEFDPLTMNTGSWTYPRIYYDLVRNMDIRNLRKTYYITEEDVRAFVDVVRKYVESAYN